MKTKKFHSFQEYLTAKGTVLTKPPVEDVPDYKGPKSVAPPKAATKGKGWQVPDVSGKSAASPYSGPSKNSGPAKGAKDGFADLGSKDLVYEPAGKPKKKVKAKGTAQTTEAFLTATKGMNTSQLAKHIKNGLTEHCKDKKAPHVVAYSVGAFHPDPIQAIRYVAYLANENVNLRHALIREAKRTGCASALLEELLALPESFSTLARIIDSKNGVSFNRRLEKAIRESREENQKKVKLQEEVDEPAHDDDLDVDKADKDDLHLDDDDGDEDGDEHHDDGDDHDGDGDEDLDLDGDGDDHGDDKNPPPPPHDDAGGDDLDLGDDDGKGPPPPPHDDAGGDDLDLGDDDGKGPPPPPHDDGDGKIDFGGHDDDDLGDDHDHDDLDDDDDLGDDHDHDDLDDDDDLGDDDDHDKLDHPKKKKMPWEDNDE